MATGETNEPAFQTPDIKVSKRLGVAEPSISVLMLWGVLPSNYSALSRLSGHEACRKSLTFRAYPIETRPQITNDAR